MAMKRLTPSEMEKALRFFREHLHSFDVIEEIDGKIWYRHKPVPESVIDALVDEGLLVADHRRRWKKAPRV